MTAVEALLVLVTGFGAGVLSSTVGVASLLSFPVLVALGLPPVVANISNTLGMIPAGLGIALLVPSVVAILAVVLLVAALEIQTRLVEEPYLLATHGDEYAGYASRVGRFFPLVGRLGQS